ncbi:MULTISPECIES: YciI family protein [unclassified Nocardioides]|uniref:YciI family protein n=1 Tax=unclassified Nocardioides TaxID=2615069 RepID=UPI0006F840D0|nr:MULTISPECIES: YciI family protein [unclassified Nocardioides]KQY56927.1 hypothetical protein ASD30_11650 [Nocardioides sp. Root140]KRF13049.1 hypothetical protein ASH02_16295 [Nocardioides sp. Soil796]
MKILVLLAERDPDAWLTASEADRTAGFDAHRAFDKAIKERGEIVAAAALDATSTARTLRAGVLTEGPYAESVEQLTGFYLIDVPSVEDALELTRILPENYTIEVRPAVKIEGYDEE